MHSTAIFARLGSVLLPLVFVAAPFMGGCSTLGIAEVKNVDEMDTRLTQADGNMSGRVDTIDGQVQTLQTSIQQIAARQDSVSRGYAEMRALMESLDIENISAEAQAASTLAQTAGERQHKLMQFYFDRLQAENTALQGELKFVQSLLDADSTGAGGATGSIVIDGTEDPGDGN